MAKRYLALLIASTTLVAVTPAHAQQGDQTIAELKAQIEALSRRVNELERSRSTAEPVSAVQADGASTARDEPGIAQQATTAAAAVSEKVAAAPIDRPMQKPGSAVQLTASSEGGEVAIRIGTTIEDARLVEGEGRASAQTLSLTASAPVAEGKKRSDIGTLDGFSDGAKLTLRWSRFLMSFGTPRTNPRPGVLDSYNRIAATARANCVTEAGSDQKAVKECQDEEINSGFIEDYAPNLLNRFDRLYQPHADLAYGLEASIGYRELDYFDGTTLEEKSVKRVPLGAKAYVTVFPDASLTSLTASFAYQRVWKDQDSAILCPAQTLSEPVKCIEGPIGSPGRQIKMLGALELRKQWKLASSLLPTFAIAPQLTYDVKAKDFGIDVPIYLVPDSEGNLLGGLRFGYSSAGKDLAVGVFVGTAFSLDN